MTEYASNSNKSRSEKQKRPEKFEKAITGTAKIRQKKGIHKLGEVFLAEDIHNVKSYILMDVIIPEIKKTILDVLYNSLDMAFNGENGRGRASRGIANTVSYSRYYTDRDRRGSRQPDRFSSPQKRVARGMNCDDIIFENRGQAEAVLTRLDEIMDNYGLVRVSDVYDISGVSCEYTNTNYGWTDISSADVVRYGDGTYGLKLPRALPLD